MESNEQNLQESFDALADIKPSVVRSSNEQSSERIEKSFDGLDKIRPPKPKE